MQDEQRLERLAKVIRDRLGLDFPHGRRQEFARGISAAFKELNLPSDASAEDLVLALAIPANVETVARHLTIGETYFFRDPGIYRVLREKLLPPLIDLRRTKGKILRLWSAGCSSGEEIYSLAILLRTIIPDIDQWNLTLLATDINTDFLTKADKGMYGDWSFRSDADGELRKRWFTPTGAGKWQVRPEVRHMVTFGYHNLADDTYPSVTNNTNAMDIIFCRNVIMYFREDVRARVIRSLALSLVEEGYLAVSATEASSAGFPGFAVVAFPDAILYRKPRACETREEKIHRIPAPSPKAPVAIPVPHAQAKASRPGPDGLLSEFEVLYQQGNYQEICRKGDLVDDRDRNFSAMVLLLARACANLGDIPKGSAWTELLLRHEPMNPAAHYLRAVVLDEQGQRVQALDSLRKAVYLDPRFVAAYVALGNHARREGDTVGAKKAFATALKILAGEADDTLVPEADGMTAGQLRRTLEAATGVLNDQQ